jgi:hypothetical protein
VFGVLVVGIHTLSKRWLNIGFNAFEMSSKGERDSYVFVRYEQGLRGKVFEGLGRFEGYHAIGQYQINVNHASDHDILLTRY